MENFGLLKFLKSPYPAGLEKTPGPPPGSALKKPPGNGEKMPENTGKNVENEVKNAGNSIKNGEIYLDFMEKQRNLSNKIGKK